MDKFEMAFYLGVAALVVGLTGIFGCGMLVIANSCIRVLGFK